MVRTKTAKAVIPYERWLRWAQIAVWVHVLLSLFLFAVGTPVFFNLLTTPCELNCSNFLQLKPVEVMALFELGWTLERYALYQIAQEFSYLIAYSLISIIIYIKSVWRRDSQAWYGLLATFGLVSVGTILLAKTSMSAKILGPGWHLLYDLLKASSYVGFLAFCLLFPNGRLVPQWARWLVVATLMWMAAWVVLPLPALDPAESVGIYISLTMLALMVGTQIYRYRQVSTAIQRQQTKWFVFGFGIVFTAVFLWSILFVTLPLPPGASRLAANLFGQGILSLLPIVFAVCICISLLRYRLWDIDLIINRTLVYGGLTLLITTAYVLLVGGIGTLAANQSGQVIGLVLATAIVVVGIRPLHRSLQVTANRFVAVPASPRSSHPSPPLEETEGGRVTRSRWLVAGMFLVALISQFALGWLTAAGCSHFSDYGSVGLLVSAASGLAFSLVGGLILFYRPHNRVGWLCLVTGFGLPTLAAIDIYVSCGLAGHLAAPGLAYLAWFVYSFGSIALIIVPMFILLPMLYPNGQFLSTRWRWLTIVGFIVLGIASLAMGLLPDFNRQNAIDHFFPVTNPFGLAYLPSWWYSFFYSMSSLTIFFLCFTGVTTMIVRLKRSVGDERQQMKWLAYFLATAVVVQLLGFELPGAFFYPQIFDTIWYELIILVVFLGFPSIIGLAIFRYRLYAIDLVINRTLVYGGLTLVVVLIYVFTVGLLSLVFHTSGSLTISLIATGLIAVAFHPVREYLQRNVNRLMFGQRDDPYAVLSHLSQQLQTTAVPTETLTSIVETIAGTLKLPYVAIELLEQEEQIGRASVGEPVGETVELPLRYQKETVGHLIVSPRSPGEKFTAKEQQLLADIAGQTGAVASATRLTLALQRSREKLVLAREEERRRIRRDLHDGLGPTLASQTLKLDTILELLDEDPQAAIEQVKTLKQQTQRMVADIRRLVYELRPPALDELGLVEALRAHFAQIRGGHNGNLHISIEASPEPLPTLPAAIEVAAYRITLEAITNVIRHAHAGKCVVRLQREPTHLALLISDDGVGRPFGYEAGIGQTSMRERAEELGGTCVVGAAQDRGTQVRAVLPFSTSQEVK